MDDQVNGQICASQVASQADSEQQTTSPRLASSSPDDPTARMGHAYAPVEEWPIFEVNSVAENFVFYDRRGKGDAEFDKTYASIRDEGILEPLVADPAGNLVSGATRLQIAEMLEFDTVPVRVRHDLSYSARPELFLAALIGYNAHRNKSSQIRLREAIYQMDHLQAYESLGELRAKQTETLPHCTVDVRGTMTRHSISEGKQGFAQAILDHVEILKEYWPIGLRMLHYRFLDKEVFRNTKSGLRYVSDQASYKDLSDMLTRLRVAGLVPHDRIADETRPEIIAKTFDNAEDYLADQIQRFGSTYFRNRMKSQNDHFEIVAEKNTIKGVIDPIAREYTIPCQIVRGKSSMPPRAAIYQRFIDSGKKRLVLFILADLDPDGLTVAETVPNSLIADFGIPASDLVAYWVGLRPEHVERFGLKAAIDLKTKAANRKRFIASYGNHAYELDALEPKGLQSILRESIDSMIDIDAYNQEHEAEQADAQVILEVAEKLREVIGPKL